MMITHDNHQMLDFSTPPKKGRKVVYHYVMLLYLYSSCFLAISIFSEGPPPNFDAFHQVMWPFAQLKWSHFGGKPDFQTPKLIRVKLSQKKKKQPMPRPPSIWTTDQQEAPWAPQQSPREAAMLDLFVSGGIWVVWYGLMVSFICLDFNEIWCFNGALMEL